MNVWINKNSRVALWPDYMTILVYVVFDLCIGSNVSALKVCLYRMKCYAEFTTDLWFLSSEVSVSSLHSLPEDECMSYRF